MCIHVLSMYVYVGGAGDDGCMCAWMRVHAC